MKSRKESSFEDFFTEDIFQEEKKNVADQPAKSIPEKQKTFIPEQADVPLEDQAAIRTFNKKLRQFFLSGSKMDQMAGAGMHPVLFAPFLRGETAATGFPVLVHGENGKTEQLSDFLQAAFHTAFNEIEAKLLWQNLSRIVAFAAKETVAHTSPVNMSTCMADAFAALQTLDVRGDEGDLFREQCRQLLSEVLKTDGVLIGFSRVAAFQLLNEQLKYRNHKVSNERKTALRKLISGLKELLILGNELSGNPDHANAAEKPFHFAADYIAFDKLADLIPAGASAGIPESRLRRINQCLQVLEKSGPYFSEWNTRIFSRPETAVDFKLEQLFSDSTVLTDATNPFQQAGAVFSSEIDNYIEFVAAAKMAELEVNNVYAEDLHDTYFATFSQRHISEDEMALFPTLIVVEYATSIVSAPERYLDILSANLPVKVLAMNRIDDLSQAEIERRDLSALTLSYRNTCIYQGAADTPSLLSEVFANTLQVAVPALWNLLDSDEPDPGMAHIQWNAAIESRLFPRFVYDLKSGSYFGSCFNIDYNAQPEKAFPDYARDVKFPEGQNSVHFSLTPADFLALNENMLKELAVVPAGFSSDECVPLSRYLSSDPDSLMGKLPYIYLVDGEDKLRQAIVPYIWVEFCRDRMGNWQFIQELGGVNSYHVNKAIERARDAWNTEKSEEIERIRSEAALEIERIRREESGKAMERLADVLLNLDAAIIPATTAVPKTVPLTQDEAVSEALPEVQEAAKEGPEEVSSEAWVESFRCTSCNDCTEQLPAVFKYNADKQAFVHNPSAGTYAKIVAIAEKCPAKCIHPGLPQNPAEPGLDELLQRAAVLN